MKRLNIICSFWSLPVDHHLLHDRALTKVNFIEQFQYVLFIYIVQLDNELENKLLSKTKQEKLAKFYHTATAHNFCSCWEICICQQYVKWNFTYIYIPVKSHIDTSKMYIN
jgi:hypothetical protein